MSALGVRGMGKQAFTFVGCNNRSSHFRDDPSFIYRCENVAQGLNCLGFESELIHLDRFRLEQAGRVVVFHRPQFSLRLWYLLALLKKKGIPIILDVDDLVFDARYASYSPGFLNQGTSLQDIRKRFSSMQKALRFFDAVTVSTIPLAEHIGQLYPDIPVVVIPNAVHLSWREENAIDSAPPEKPVITYFPGTRSHDRDFKLISKVIEGFLQKHPEVELHVTGHLQTEIFHRSQQVVKRSKVPFSEYHRQFQGGWVNLSPLEDTPFNRCKSALKVIEAGFWNIPTVCSPFPDSERFDGSGALLAKSEDDWVEHLESLLDTTFYAEQVQRLREKVLDLACVKDISSRYVSFLESNDIVPSFA